MRKKPAPRYFLYREAPFRPLYEGGAGFREPPNRTEVSLSRKGFHLWVFTTRHLARAMCGAQRPVCSYAELSEFRKLSAGRDPFAPPAQNPITAMKRGAKRPQRKPSTSNLHDLV